MDSIVSLPGTSKKDREAASEKEPADSAKEDDKDSDRKNEVQVDQACWIYEQLRYDFVYRKIYVLFSTNCVADDLHKIYLTLLSQHCNRNVHARPAPK